MSRRLLLVSHGIMMVFGLYYSVYLLLVNPETFFSIEQALSYHPTFDHMLFVFFKFLLIFVSSLFAFVTLHFFLPFCHSYSFIQGMILLALALIVVYLPFIVRIFLGTMGIFQCGTVIYQKFFQDNIVNW
ncbi:hypothetical protein EsVE80_15530 [Enterococcus saigonensis]|uniref:Uncharacterized protein n=1 Tax=Enterococcus saigonensis TaxID=1805431 RepID=A0A679ICL1_9ENTE|nr:hypothetical protein [Enterococcus saigonensis]BCA86030.1 hypothetical protein EsVE80_15530 [Enterococcus saigonensis]